MERLIVFGLLSIPLLILSWRTLFDIRSHGFYRFFSWEGILWLFISNREFWFHDPFSIKQVFSWLFLIISAYLVIAGSFFLKNNGKSISARIDNTLFQFEKTSALVETGIFRYIRHPMYASLLFLTWGIFLKNTTLTLSIVSLLSSVLLYLTALSDEKECIRFFGNEYLEYMKRSRRFIPFLL